LPLAHAPDRPMFRQMPGSATASGRRIAGARGRRVAFPRRRLLLEPGPVAGRHEPARKLTTTGTAISLSARESRPAIRSRRRPGRRDVCKRARPPQHAPAHLHSPLRRQVRLQDDGHHRSMFNDDKFLGQRLAVSASPAISSQLRQARERAPPAPYVTAVGTRFYLHVR